MTAHAQAGRRPLRPGLRARRLRRRVRRAARRHGLARDGAAGAPRAREPRAPRRLGRRRRDRRRRRDPPADTRRVLPRAEVEGLAASRPLRRRRRSSSPTTTARRAELEELVERTVADEGQRFLVLAGRPGRLLPGRDGLRRCRAAHPPGRDRRGRRPRGRRLRAQALRDPPRRRARGRARSRRAEPLVADARLQGDADGAAARAASTSTSPTRASRRALALVHSRYSTNTFPSWELAHPYRLIAHNGEINTLRGNVNWMRARESQLASELFGDDLAKVLPVIRPGGSDTGDVRQRARAARARRPLAAARADDDDPGVVRGPRRHDRASCAASTRSTSA